MSAHPRRKDAMDPDVVSLGRHSTLEERVSLHEVYDASYRKILVQLYGLTGDLEVAEDVVHEAFVRAASSGRRFLHEADRESWLRTTAIHVHRGRWRALRAGRPAPEPRTTHDMELGPEQLVVMAALRSLPEQQREVVALHYLADLSVRATAEELDVRARDVRPLLDRGRATLAVLLTPPDGTPATPDLLVRAFREEAECVTPVPAFEPVAAAGRKLHRRHHSVAGAACACLLAPVGFLALGGQEPSTEVTRGDDPRSEGVMTYPGPLRAALPRGHRELHPAVGDDRPVVSFALPGEWNSWEVANRVEEMAPGVSDNEELFVRAPWHVGLLVLEVEHMARRGCTVVDVSNQDPAGLVDSLTRLPLRVTSGPETASGFGVPATHLRLRGGPAPTCLDDYLFTTSRYSTIDATGPDTTYDAWVLDVGGRPLLVWGVWTDTAPPSEVDELLEVIDSLEVHDD
jgi:RNA polymerase sigma-70 factor (ECF subfamily)